MNYIDYKSEVTSVFSIVLEKHNFLISDFHETENYWEACFVNNKVALEIGQEFRRRSLNIDICRLDEDGTVPHLLKDKNQNGKLNRLNFDFLLRIWNEPVFNLDSGPNAMMTVGPKYAECLNRLAGD